MSENEKPRNVGVYIDQSVREENLEKMVDAIERVFFSAKQNERNDASTMTALKLLKDIAKAPTNFNYCHFSGLDAGSESIAGTRNKAASDPYSAYPDHYQGFRG